ncbi:MAG: L-threonylcarbamoyladenylate synthase [Thermodesulfobacteriota bacterium]
MPGLIKIDPQAISLTALRPAVEALLDGGVLAGPTQSFYGLMAAADKAPALERIMTLKGREPNKPLLLLLDQPLRLTCYARELPESAQGLAAKFWPGPLTLLLRARRGLHPALVGPTRTVGVRVEGLPAIRTLIRALDRAITGTSANPGGRPPALTAEEVQAYFGDKIDLILDGGPCPGGAGSTLIDVSIGPPRLVRDGGLSLDEMVSVAPDMRT